MKTIYGEMPEDDKEAAPSPEKKHLTWLQEARLALEQLGVHVMTMVVSREIVSQIYGEPQSWLYFVGGAAATTIAYRAVRKKEMLGKKDEEES